MDTTQVSNFVFDSISLEAIWPMLLKLLIILAVGLPIILLIRTWARRFFGKRYTPHYGMVAGKVTLYIGLTIIVITIMSQLGLSMAPLLGAAGILGIAIGFASQTSVSNIISGLFLITEAPFKVEDVIRIGNTTGIVMAIDMLSVKLRTFDNQFVRIPNESIIKTEVINLTRFPVRRFDAMVSVAYKENIKKVREVLLKVAEENEFCLSEPRPMVVFRAFGASSVDLELRVWGLSQEYLNLKISIYEEIKEKLDNADIEIPFPHVSVYKGEATAPIPIEIQGWKEISEEIRNSNKDDAFENDEPKQNS